MPAQDIIFWFRRDLRLVDNAGLYHALKHAKRAQAHVHLVFVFDTTILKHLPKHDRRVCFIWDCIQALNLQLAVNQASIKIVYGDPIDLIPALASKLNVQAVYTNHDDEPQSIRRDLAVKNILQQYYLAFE